MPILSLRKGQFSLGWRPSQFSPVAVAILTLKMSKSVWAQLKSKVEVVEPLFDTPCGTRKFTIRDLDGNELGFVKG